LRSAHNPIRVNNGAHHSLDFLAAHALESLGELSLPGRVGVGVNVSNVGRQVEGSFLKEQVLNRLAAFAEIHVHAGSLGLGEVNELVGALESVDSLLELGEHSVDLIDGGIVAVVGVVHHVLAEVANEVGLSKEVVDTASVGESGKACNECGFHLVNINY
jgi:hypothetical protein